METASMRTSAWAALALIGALLLASSASADCPPVGAGAEGAAAPETAAPEVPELSPRQKLEQLAWSHLDRGEYERAAELADALLAEAPDDPTWQRSWIQIVYDAPGRRDEALAAGRRLVAERPADAEARRLLAQLLSWNGSQDEAMKIYDGLLAEYPDDVESLKGRAEMARWDHDPFTAERLLKRAAAAAPDDVEVTTALNEVAPLAAQLRASRSDPTFVLLLGLLTVPTVLGFASRHLTSTTWTLLLVWVAMLLWVAAHLVAPE